jgi:hypothetical protein
LGIIGSLNERGGQSGSTMDKLSLKPGAIALPDLRRISRGADPVGLADGWRRGVEESLAAVGRRARRGAHGHWSASSRRPGFPTPS